MRVRFAPSPTGHLHVGNARTALFNWLLARHAAARSSFASRTPTSSARRASRSRRSWTTCEWMGLTWDEGVEPAATYGPYRQSERLAHLRRPRAQLLERRRALLLLLFRGEARGRAPGDAASRGCRRSTPARAARSRPTRRGARGARREGGHPPARARRSRGHLRRHRARPGDVSHRRHRRSRAGPLGRHARLQLRRGRSTMR